MKNLYFHPKFKGANDNLKYEKFNASAENFANFLSADFITRENLIRMERERTEIKMEVERIRKQEKEMNDGREKAQQALRDFWQHKKPEPKKTIWKKLLDFFVGK